MYRLTELRLKKAETILEKYRAQLHKTNSIVALVFERELRDCWKLGYQEMKGIAKELARIKRYKYLAAYYMENSGSGTSVVGEFQQPLARLYGIPRYDNRELRKAAREIFWKGMKGKA